PSPHRRCGVRHRRGDRRGARGRPGDDRPGAAHRPARHTHRVRAPEKRRWRADGVRRSVSDHDHDVLNDSGLPLEPVYSVEDRRAEEPLPGAFPYTRGIHKDMYRGRPWTMRQYAGFGTAAESNKRYRVLLKQGQTGRSGASDRPTRIGYDSDDPRADGEGGTPGAAIDTPQDREIRRQDMPLGAVSAAEEIALTLSHAIAYVEAAQAAGLSVGDFAPRVSFFFACHMDFFEEVAKFRAARRMWARIMRDRFHAHDPRSQALRFHTQTG